MAQDTIDAGTQESILLCFGASHIVALYLDLFFDGGKNAKTDDVCCQGTRMRDEASPKLLLEERRPPHAGT